MRRERPRRVLVRVPATTSNLGSGFDVLGLALTLYNELEAVSTSGAGNLVRVEGEGSDTLPRDENNEVARVLSSRAPRLAADLRLTNRIPIARGLGSSAAARLAALLAARALAGPEGDDVLEAATALEGHPDNVVPALFGGVRLSVRDGGAVVQVALRSPSPRDLKVVACVPGFELSTEKARRVLPARIPRSDAVFASGRVGLLAHAFDARRYDLLKTAMQDVLHQPYRAALVPGMKQVIEGALAAGAFGASLSGAGPAMLAFAAPGKAGRVGRAMQKAFLAKRVDSRVLVLDVDTKGAVIR